jgi:hypothetical protein
VTLLEFGVQLVAVQVRQPSVPGGPTVNDGVARLIVNVVEYALPAQQAGVDDEQVFCVAPAVPEPP